MAIKVSFGAKPLQYVSELQMQTYEPTWIELSGVEGLDDFEITFRKANTDDGSNNVTQESISKELNFFGASRNFLHEQLIIQKQELVYVKIEDDCPDCGLLHFGIIKRKNLKSCDCDDFYSAQINGISQDEVIKARLESITVMDNDLGSYYNPNDNAGTNVLFQLAQESLNRRRMIDTYAVPGIPIRKIMESIGDRLSFNAYSSIFFEYLTMMQWSGDDYTPQLIPQGYNIYNPYFYLYLVYFPIVNQRQKQRQQTFKNFADQNNNTYFSGGMWQPIKRENWISWSAYSFLNRLAEVFNAQWRIKNGLLELERRDYFQLGENQWKDLTNEKVCYTIADFGDFAYLDIGFAGSKGEVQSTLNPRSNVLCNSNILQNPWIDFSTEHLESLVSWGNDLTFVKRQPLIKRFDFGYAPIIRYNGRNKISLKEGTTPNPLLLIGAQNSAINRKFIWGELGTFQHQPMTTDKYKYNYCINERRNELFEENLYDNFHYIDDPNQEANSKGYFGKNKQYLYSFTVEEVPFNCANFDNFDINKTVNTKRGLGIMEEVTFNWSRKTVTIQGRV